MFEFGELRAELSAFLDIQGNKLRISMRHVTLQHSPHCDAFLSVPNMCFRLSM